MPKVKYIRIPRVTVINRIRNSHREFLTVEENLLEALEIVHRGRMEALQKILSRIDERGKKNEEGEKYCVMPVEEIEKEISYWGHREKKAYEEGNEERALFLDGYVDAMKRFISRYYLTAMRSNEENEKTD